MAKESHHYLLYIIRKRKANKKCNKILSTLTWISIQKSLAFRDIYKIITEMGICYLRTFVLFLLFYNYYYIVHQCNPEV